MRRKTRAPGLHAPLHAERARPGIGHDAPEFEPACEQRIGIGWWPDIRATTERLADAVEDQALVGFAPRRIGQQAIARDQAADRIGYAIRVELDARAGRKRGRVADSRNLAHECQRALCVAACERDFRLDAHALAGIRRRDRWHEHADCGPRGGNVAGGQPFNCGGQPQGIPSVHGRAARRGFVAAGGSRMITLARLTARPFRSGLRAAQPVGDLAGCAQPD